MDPQHGGPLQCDPVEVPSLPSARRPNPFVRKDKVLSYPVIDPRDNYASPRRCREFCRTRPHVEQSSVLEPAQETTTDSHRIHSNAGFFLRTLNSVRLFERALSCCNSWALLVRQEGLEPPTPGLEGPCSIQLSYCRISGICVFIEQRIERYQANVCSQDAQCQREFQPRSHWHLPQTAFFKTTGPRILPCSGIFRLRPTFPQYPHG